MFVHKYKLINIIIIILNIIIICIHKISTKFTFSLISRTNIVINKIHHQ